MLTRRTTQREFLLRPDALMNAAFLYCLAVAAQRYSIDIILPQLMSNHHHTILFDRYAKIVEFTTYFHSLLARCGNSMRGRWEYFWSSGGPSYVELADRSAVLDELVYAATNPVKDNLVTRVCHWPSVNVLSALLNNRTIEVRRPHTFFREHGPMPETVTLTLTIPPELGDADLFRAQVRDRVAAIEAEHDDERARTGRRVLGRRRVLRQSWRDRPESLEPRRNRNPRVATRCKETRIAAIERRLQFESDHAKARAAWLAGAPIPFPVGTYWLRRFVGVPIVSTET